MTPPTVDAGYAPGVWASARTTRSGGATGVARIPVMAHIAIVTVGIGVLFAVLQVPFRHLEVVAATGLCHLFGFTGIRHPVESYMLIQPSGHAPFWVDIAPTCSSLASILSFVGLATFVSPRARQGISPLRFWSAVAAAAAVLFVGNLLRIVFSMLVGLVAGRISLVLFHNWVGSIFGFASLLAGWVLLLWLILPAPPGRHRWWQGRRPTGEPPLEVQR